MKKLHNITPNPTYIARGASDVMYSGGYSSSLNGYEAAIAQDPVFDFIPAYNMAYAMVGSRTAMQKIITIMHPQKLQNIWQGRLNIFKTPIMDLKCSYAIIESNRWFSGFQDVAY